ncbi:MAG TPA: carboxypeptidase-like regulatory domain-containing protein [Terriglobia bacterium]|nr:carboxypeptidase-like regulatory domain-containing protein [Terriglobia bacterium]
MKLPRFKFLTPSVAYLVLLSSGAARLAAGGKISGQVLNGTTGNPVAGQKLQLLMPRGGMQQVSTAVTDANGQFVVASSDLATDSFYLLQATYQDVNYHAPVKFDDRGQARADITVYDSTRTAPPLRIESARIILHAEGDKVHVQEMFAIRNPADPPRSYVNAEGTFLFHLSKTTGEPTAAVAGLMNMPLPEPVNPGKGPGDFYIQYPLKPGLTVMMVAYDSDYASNKLGLTDSVAYPIDSVEMLVSPSNLSVDSPLFKAAGADAETGSQKYLAESVPPNAQLAASVSGEAAASETAAGGALASQTDSQVKVLPNSMSRMGGPLLACFLLVLLWGLGVRVAKEWPKWKAQQSASQLQKALEAEVENLFNSIADLDELFAAGKIAEKPYWKERLELKARLVATLKKAPPALLESYAIRHTPH